MLVVFFAIFATFYIEGRFYKVKRIKEFFEKVLGISSRRELKKLRSDYNSLNVSFEILRNKVVENDAKIFELKSEIKVLKSQINRIQNKKGMKVC